MLKKISSSIFSSRLFNFMFSQEIAKMQMKTIHDFKVKTLTEIKEAKAARVEKAAATEVVSQAIQINKMAAHVNEDKKVKEKVEEKVRFKKKYGEAVEKNREEYRKGMAANPNAWAKPV